MLCGNPCYPNLTPNGNAIYEPKVIRETKNNFVIICQVSLLSVTQKKEGGKFIVNKLILVLQSERQQSNNILILFETHLYHYPAGKLGDYVDCPEDKENDTCMTITRTPKSSKKAVCANGLKENNTPSKQLPQTPKAIKQHMPAGAAILAVEKQLTPSKNPMLMSRIQRDLNSPSASVRVRALKAITYVTFKTLS